MEIPVVIVRWPTASLEGIAVDEREAAVYELPVAGGVHWRSDGPHTVVDVEVGPPARIHLTPDVDRACRIVERLPAGFSYHCGRSASSGLWHATIHPPAGGIQSDGVSDTSGDAAIEQALAKANF